MKKNALLIAILIFPLMLFAQDWKVEYGEPYNKKYKTGWGGDAESSKFLGLNNQSYFITYESKKHGDILQFDFNHNLVNTIPVGKTPDGKKLEVKHLLKIKSGDYLISSYYNKKKKRAWVYATLLNKDGSMDKIKESLFSYASIDYRKSFYQGTGIRNDDFNGYQISSDSSKIVFTRVYRSMQSSDVSGNERYQIFVFDYNLKKIWEREILLPNVDRKVQVKQVFVTNEGEVFLLAKNKPKEGKRRWWRPQEDIIIIRVNNAGKNEMKTLRLKKSFLVSAAMFSDNEDLFVFGIYTNGKRELRGADGIFMMKFDEKDELTFSKKYPFEEKIRQGLIPSRRKGSDYNFYNFEIDDLLIDYKNGHFLFVTENRYASSLNETTVTDDLIVSKFSFEGELEWTFHKKKNFKGYQGSYGLSYQGDNIYLIYNTIKTTKEKKQVQHKRRPNFTSFYTDIIKINKEGKAYFEDTIYHSRERKLRVSPALSKRIYNGNFLLYFSNAKKFKYGT